MSMQQINLYSAEFRPSREWLTSSTVAISAVGFCALLAVSVVIGRVGLAEVGEQAQQLEQQLAASRVRVKTAIERPRPHNEALLDERIAQLKRALNNRQRIGQIIQGQNLGNEAGFSQTLTALARQSLPSVSLAQIKLSRGGKLLELAGLTQAPKDVPRYIQQLQTEAAIDGVQFGLLSVAQSERDSALHEFSLGFDSVYKLAAERDAK